MTTIMGKKVHNRMIMPSSMVIKCKRCYTPLLLTTGKIYDGMPLDEYRSKFEIIRHRVSKAEVSLENPIYVCNTCRTGYLMYNLIWESPREQLKISHLERLEGEKEEDEAFRYYNKLHSRKMRYRRKK